MTFSRYIEIGRVCLINYGPDRNKLCTVINVVDQSRVREGIWYCFACVCGSYLSLGAGAVHRDLLHHNPAIRRSSWPAHTKGGLIAAVFNGEMASREVAARTETR